MWNIASMGIIDPTGCFSASCYFSPPIILGCLPANPQTLLEWVDSTWQWLTDVSVEHGLQRPRQYFRGSVRRLPEIVGAPWLF